MCKFESDNAPGYEVVAEAIQRYATEAPSLIRERWNEEHRIRDYEREGAAREILRDRTNVSGQQTPSTESSPAQRSGAIPSMSAPPKNLPSQATSYDYEIEEVVDELATPATRPQ
jgi:protein SERAC1